MSAPRKRRAAVTGIGVVAPGGTSTEAFWKSTQEGVSVLDRVTREGCEHLPLKVAGEVRSFEPSAAVEERYLVQTDRFTHFAMAAADAALQDARLGQGDTDAAPFSAGVVTAAGSGGGEFGQRELQKLWGKGSRYVGPWQSIAWFYAASTGQISIRRGFKGPCSVVAADEAGGLD
ncbi:beta-ketoacyl synthase N-terminal-like domain-containing protein, partial [Streptomyces sp. NPDC127105]